MPICRSDLSAAGSGPTDCMVGGMQQPGGGMFGSASCPLSTSTPAPGGYALGFVPGISGGLPWSFPPVATNPTGGGACASSGAAAPASPTAQLSWFFSDSQAAFVDAGVGAGYGAGARSAADDGNALQASSAHNHHHHHYHHHHHPFASVQAQAHAAAAAACAQVAAQSFVPQPQQPLGGGLGGAFAPPPAEADTNVRRHTLSPSAPSLPATNNGVSPSLSMMSTHSAEDNKLQWMSEDMVQSYDSSFTSGMSSVPHSLRPSSDGGVEDIVLPSAGVVSFGRQAKDEDEPVSPPGGGAGGMGTSSGRVRSTPERRCQGDHCRIDLKTSKRYYKRRKLCGDCIAAFSVMVRGQEMRYCQQCSCLHNIREFDQGRRSCRAKLEKHKLRARKMRSSSTSVSSAGASEPRTSDA